jgi:hypothetical protein
MVINSLQIFRDAFALYSGNHIKHKYGVWAECRVFSVVKQVVHIVTTGACKD